MSYGESPQFDEEIVDKIFNFYGVCGNFFKLDNKVWEVVEDPDDGYRSALDEVRPVEDASGLVFFLGPIAQVRIEEIDREYVELGKGWENNFPDFGGYKLVDITDNHVWLIFGTDDLGDWYPGFRFEYRPKSTSDNS